MKELVHMKKPLSREKVLDLLQVTSEQLDKMIAEGKFSRPVSVAGEDGDFWLATDVERILKSRSRDVGETGPTLDPR